MICPECNLENTAGAKFCIRCGSMLTQTEITAPSANRTNQVWNTDIDKEQNQKNSRAALAALGVSVLLLLALCAALLISLPSMGDALIGERENGQSFTDRFSDFWDFFTDSFGSIEPEPSSNVVYAIEMSEISGTADDEFMTDFPALLTFTYDNCYDDIWAATQERRLLEPYRTAPFDDARLQELALRYITALDDLLAATTTDDDGNSYIDNTPWNLAYNDQCLIVALLQEEYDIFPEDSLHIPIFFSVYGLYSFEREQVEQIFDDSLTGINAHWDNRKRTYTIELTNTSAYIAELTVYNDYETEEDWLWEEDSVLIAPNETVTIELETMPDDYENWYIDVYITELYMEEDYSLYDSYWDYYFDLFTK